VNIESLAAPWRRCFNALRPEAGRSLVPDFAQQIGGVAGLKCIIGAIAV